MAVDVLSRQAGIRAKQLGETFEEAFKAVLETEAGRQLKELRDGPHRDKRAEQWQKDLVRERARERARARLAAAWIAAHEQEDYLARKRVQAEERRRIQRAAAWEWFIKEERRELQLRKEGQLARLLGEPLSGESKEALQRLASEDQRQAEEGLVALMRGGEVFYKHIDELCVEDVPLRMAASRLRMTWLKERADMWLGRGEVPL